jgi:hypothetical protein
LEHPNTKTNKKILRILLPEKKKEPGSLIPAMNKVKVVWLEQTITFGELLVPLFTYCGDLYV